MINRIPLFIVLMAFAAIAGTTNVRIYHQAVASPASVQSKQIGVNTSADASLGYKMWFGKDADGNVTQFLAKDKNARMLSVRQDSSFSIFDTSKHYRSPLANFDSSKSTALMSTRSYSGISKNDSVYSYRDTAKIMKADSGNFTKLNITRLTGASKIAADTIQAVKLFNMSSTNNSYIGSGDIWHDSTECTFETFTNNIRGTLNRCLFAQTNIVLDSNSTSEVSLFGIDSIHSFDSLPANWFVKGKRLKFTVAGIYSTKATTPGNITVNFKLNNTIIVTTGAIALDANEINSTWSLEGAIVCRSIGSSGSVVCVTNWNHGVLSGGTDIIHSAGMYTLGTTISTIIKQKPNLTVQFTTADVSNKIRSVTFILEEIH